jgi:hypothetical protein
MLTVSECPINAMEFRFEIGYDAIMGLSLGGLTAL